MRLALLGGTGDIGEGLALRFAADTDHELVIGSRDAAKAVARAEDYETYLADHGIDRELDGDDNAAAAADADVVVLAIPPNHVADTVEQLTDADVLSDQLLVSPAVGMKGDKDGLHYNPPSTGSVTEYVAERAPDGVSVAGAFHNLAADRLADLDATLESTRWSSPTREPSASVSSTSRTNSTESEHSPLTSSRTRPRWRA